MGSEGSRLGEDSSNDRQDAEEDSPDNNSQHRDDNIHMEDDQLGGGNNNHPRGNNNQQAMTPLIPRSDDSDKGDAEGACPERKRHPATIWRGEAGRQTNKRQTQMRAAGQNETGDADPTAGRDGSQCGVDSDNLVGRTNLDWTQAPPAVCSLPIAGVPLLLVTDIPDVEKDPLFVLADAMKQHSMRARYTELMNTQPIRDAWNSALHGLALARLPADLLVPKRLGMLSPRMLMVVVSVKLPTPLPQVPMISLLDIAHDTIWQLPTIWAFATERKVHDSVCCTASFATALITESLPALNLPHNGSPTCAMLACSGKLTSNLSSTLRIDLRPMPCVAAGTCTTTTLARNMDLATAAEIELSSNSHIWDWLALRLFNLLLVNMQHCESGYIQQRRMALVEKLCWHKSISSKAAGRDKGFWKLGTT
ncbi:hypothetical protein BDK51DRAFT_44654 [Blyttiomyces helicus]|uniref:Uncharacterized protein n=1 Tax=Blyttiomyces helicus TaxID=388810 RepID=A0A4P9VXR2_9FUNG|nr:hypothetical protein BDK51DRAFT_44654 [Blyttiomyces helicus]|eukprot:RKO83078.1 hypothetical protein BDK51DRAFT_44654 [Blyttiomyces helicus]